MKVLQSGRQTTHRL